MTAVDGGVAANNPAMCAYTEAMKWGFELIHQPFRTDEIALLSLGTGDVKAPIHYKDASSWGMVKWVRPLIDVLFGGASNAVDHELKNLFKVSALWLLYSVTGKWCIAVILLACQLSLKP